jgi:hypothetical protein
MATNAGYIFAQFVLQPGGDWRNSTSNIKTKSDITISPHKAQGHPGLRYSLRCQKGYICFGTIREFTLNFAVRVELLLLLIMFLVSRSMDLRKITCICYLCWIDKLLFICRKAYYIKRTNYFQVTVRCNTFRLRRS